MSTDSIEDQPDPPIVGRVTHNSIELFFDSVCLKGSQSSVSNPTNIKYIVQEEELGGLVTKGYGTVYSGFARLNEFTGLEPRTTYRYRVKRKHLDGESPWSRCVEVSTTQKPPSAEDLHRAVQHNNIQAVTKLLQELPKDLINAPDKYGYSPLMAAAFKGYKEIACVLIKNFADVNYQNSSGKNALMMACYSGQLELVRLLRSSDGNWTDSDHSGLSPLHWAVDGGNDELVRWMIKDGCSVDSKDRVSEWTPLMRLASMKGGATIARILINNGADVNAVDKTKKSTLMMAALNGHTDLVNLLLSNGAKVELLSDHNKTALDFARSFNHRDIIESLECKMKEHNERTAALDKSRNAALHIPAPAS